MAKQPVRVHIFNQIYTVLADEDPSRIQAIAQELDELMTMIATRAGSGDSARVAVLAALHMADKLRTAESRLQSLEGQSTRIAALLDQLLEA
jgi:cell division protein ZapA (FtsZ GTPase activity inhibitor)